MSIFAYVGMPGSGKSYDVVCNQILPALKNGRRVVTNIPLHKDKIALKVQSGELVDFPTEAVSQSPELIWDYATPGCVLILDEVWRIWPSGQKSNQVPEPFRKLLAEHRHMVNEAGDSMQVVLVTQDLAQIGAFARQLVETTYYHTKLSSVGMSKSYRIDIYQGPQTGANPPKQARIREIFGTFSKDMFELYQSHTMSQKEGAGANEKPADARANIWKRPMIWVGLAFIIVAVTVGFGMAKSFFQSPGTVEQAQSAQPSQIQPGHHADAAQPLGVAQHHQQSYALACMRHVYQSGDVTCECRGADGGLALSGYQCIKYMDDHVGGYGGPDAKQINIDYLNARDNPNHSQAITSG